MTDPKIIVAIDSSKLSEANAILDKLDPSLCKIKIGSVTFNALGKSFLQSVTNRGFKIFLDLKFHDIPNTVKETITSFKGYSVEMLTVHLSGGEKMLKQAMIAASNINAKVIGVSILTSLDEADILDLFNNSINEQIINLFMMAKKNNLDGIVCSPKELNLANKILGSNFIKITPGIRDSKQDDDQVRVLSAEEAINSGASFLVIGRPITRANNIASALLNFSNLIDE